MRYECTSETLYINYRTGETLEYRHSNLRLLTARANNGTSDAKKYMALIEQTIRNGNQSHAIHTM